MDGGAARKVSPRALREMIEGMLPAAVVVHTAGADTRTDRRADGDVLASSGRPSRCPPGRLSGRPDGRLDDSRPSRPRRFQQGRACAQRALADLGSAEIEVGRGPRREPLWPSGFVGSITHMAGLSAVAVGPTTSFRAIGIDAEPNEPLPDGVEELVVSDAAELSAVGRSASPMVSWPTVLFSAKESVYKAWYPDLGRWLDFHDVRVELSPVTATAGVFRVAPGATRPMAPEEERFVGGLRGRFDVDPAIGVVTTTAVLSAVAVSS